MTQILTHNRPHISGYKVPRVQLVDQRMRPINASMFGEMRTAEPYGLLDHYHRYGIDPDVWYTATAGGGSVDHSATDSAALLSVGAALGDRALLRTHTYFRYQASRGLQNTVTEIPLDLPAGATLGVVRRTSTSGLVVDNWTEVPLTGWSFDSVDTSALQTGILNENANSGMSFNLGANNIYQLEFQWLSAGDVDFFINGGLVARLSHPGTLLTPYMRPPVLPVSHEIINTAEGQRRRWGFYDDSDGLFWEIRHPNQASRMLNVCSAVAIQGGQEPPSHSYGAYNPADVTVTTAETPLIAIRLASLYGGITNRSTHLPKIIAVSTEGGRAGFRLVLNPATLTGGAGWIAVGGTSGSEQNTGATAFTGGTTILRGMLAQSNDGREVNISELFGFPKHHLRLNGTSGTSDVLLLTGICEQVGSCTMRGSITWAEVR